MSLDTYFGLSKPDEKKEMTVKSALADIVFEPRSVYEGKHKKLYTFDASLRALRKRGYERHPRPAEAFDLICRGLERKLQPEQQAIVDDMTCKDGEWLSMVVTCKRKMLHCYLDPENLIWDGNKYVVQGGKLKHAGEEVYSIGSLCGWVPIKNVNGINPLLIEKLWSRPYAILPEEIRQDALIWLPPENVLVPVGSSHRGQYDVYAYFNYRASRGVSTR